MRPVATLIACLFALVCCVGESVAQPVMVIGVASDDALNMRADIDDVDHFSKAPVVARIPPGATDVTATGRAFRLGGALWREIRFQGRTGWVNDRFVQRTDPFPPDPQFRCGGTEPFWDIDFNETEARITQMVDPGAITLTTLDWAGAVGRPDVRSYRFRRSDGSGEMTGIVSWAEACSDGMSDYDFSYSFFLLGLDPRGGLYTGCCMLR